MSGLYEQRCDMLQEQNEHDLDLSGQSMQGDCPARGSAPVSPIWRWMNPEKKNMTKSIESTVDCLKEMIDRNGPSCLTDESYEVFKE